MTRLGNRLVDMQATDPLRMVDGVVSSVSPLTVTAGSSTVAVPAVSLLPVKVGDKVQILRQGASALVLGSTTGSPRGIVAFAQVTADQLNIATAGTITGLSVTFTAATDRRYEICGRALVRSQVANAFWSFSAFRPSIAELGSLAGFTAYTGNDVMMCTGSRVFSPSAGSVTVSTSLVRTTASGLADMLATSDNPAQLWVKDIGPA